MVAGSYLRRENPTSRICYLPVGQQYILTQYAVMQIDAHTSTCGCVHVYTGCALFSCSPGLSYKETSSYNLLAQNKTWFQLDRGEAACSHVLCPGIPWSTQAPALGLTASWCLTPAHFGQEVNRKDGQKVSNTAVQPVSMPSLWWCAWGTKLLHLPASWCCTEGAKGWTACGESQQYQLFCCNG